MSTAIIETTGNDKTVVGVWLAEADQGAPDVAFTDETQQLMAEQVLGEAAERIDADGTTWAEFMHNLFQRQNHLTVKRVWVDDWAGTDPQALLAAAIAQQDAGLPLVDVAP